MKGNFVNLPITITLLMLSFIPWPGPTIFKISCPRDSARIVRKVVRTKWIPLLEKYKVKLPLECPFHPHRDIFFPQQAMKKQHRPSQWTCGICGKSFFEEQFLDIHFDNRHKGIINLAEDAVCLADYCDIMRCDVLSLIELKSEASKTENTDIEIWREASAYSKALMTSGPRDIAKYVLNNGHLGLKKSGQKCAVTETNKCQKAEEKDAASIKEGSTTNDGDAFQQNFSTNNNMCQSDLVDSALPAPDERQQRINKIQKLKADCKPEELQKVKTKCEILVRDCIANLLIHLSVKDFREIEEELNRAICWYLTCDRYWEDSQEDIKMFPWGILCMAFMLLSLGFCFCYYIVWVLFDISSTDDGSVTSASMTDRSTPSPAHARRPDSSSTMDGVHVYSEDYIGSDKESDYIYVTYPPDLKRRLLESCYNRTTRL